MTQLGHAPFATNGQSKVDFAARRWARGLRTAALDTRAGGALAERVVQAADLLAVDGSLDKDT